MSDEYTPSMNEIRLRYARIVRRDGTPTQEAGRQKEFDRAIAAHDQELREQIAQAIEAKADDPDPTLEPQYFMAMDIAASIARGDGE